MFGERIRTLRKEAKLNQADLAVMTGVSRPNISFWENSEYPPLEAIVKVCQALKIPVWEFFLTDEAKAGLYGISPEAMLLIERLGGLDSESLHDVMELFYSILGKYEKALSRQESPSHPAIVYNQTSEENTDMIMHDGLPDKSIAPPYLTFFARNAGRIALEHYLNNFLFLSH